MKPEQFKQMVENELAKVKDTLIIKNRKYGNSALEPKRVFSKASAKEQLLVRIDDKLSRIANESLDEDEDEDVVLDLIGYLVLYKIASKISGAN